MYIIPFNSPVIHLFKIRREPLAYHKTSLNVVQGMTVRIPIA